MPYLKDNLVSAIRHATKCSKSAAEQAYGDFVNELSEAVCVGGEATLYGFGTFTREKTAARQGRNPRTGEPIPIPAGWRVKFKAGKKLRDGMPAD